MAKNLTVGDFRKNLAAFAVPFLFANMLQALMVPLIYSW